MNYYYYLSMITHRNVEHFSYCSKTSGHSIVVIIINYLYYFFIYRSAWSFLYQ